MISLSTNLSRKMKTITLVLLLCGLILSTFSASIPRTLLVDSDSLSPAQETVSASDVDWWPMFHHDLRHSGYSTSEAPDTNETSWSYKTPGETVGVTSSPAVADGKVFFGSKDAKVYCLDASAGAFIWRFTTGGFVDSSPAVADGKVFVGSYDAKVYCLDALTGAFIWDYTTGGAVLSSPAVADGRAYVSSWDNVLYCLDEATGAYVWSYPISASVTSSPAVAYGKVYEGSGEKVICLDAATGAFIWDFPIPSGPMFSSPAVADGKVYVGATNAKFYCLDAFTGALIWSYTAGGGFSQYGSAAVAYGKVYRGSFDRKFYCLDAVTGAFIWSRATGFYVESSPAVADGKVFVGSDDTKVYCLDAFTGAFIWSYKTGGYVLSSPAIADGRVFVGSNDGFVYAFGASAVDWPTFHHDTRHSGYSTSEAPDTNETSWSYRTGNYVVCPPTVAYGKVFVGSTDAKIYCLDAATGSLGWDYTTGGRVYSSPAVADGKVFVGSLDWRVYCLDAATGAFGWGFTTGDVVISSPAVANGRVFIGSFDHKVYCLDAATGALVWSYITGGRVYSSPAVADGKVFVGSEDNRVYCLDAATGAYIWDYPTGGFVESSPAVADGKVFVGSYDHKVYCLDAVTGALVWSYATGNSVLSSPAVADGKVFVGSLDWRVYCLDAATGAFGWSYGTGWDVSSSPAVADGKVFVGSEDNKVYCLDAFTGRLVWSYTTWSSVVSSPAVGYDRIYIGLYHNIHAFGPDWWLMGDHDASRSKFSTSQGPTTNKTLWTYRVGTLPPEDQHTERIVSSPAIAYGKVYFGARDNKTYCLDAATGALKWCFNPLDAFPTRHPANFHSPAVADGKVYITASGGYYPGTYWDYFYRLDAATGDCDWTFESYNTGGFGIDSPIVADGLLFLEFGGNILVFNITTRQSWWIETGAFSQAFGFAVYYGRVYITYSYAAKDYLSCYNYLGDPLWSYEFSDPPGLPDVWTLSGPVVVEGRVYAAAYMHSQADYGLLCCFDASSGSQLWSPKMVGATSTWSDPAVAYRRVYMVSRVGGYPDRLFCYDALTGDDIWASSYVSLQQMPYSPVVAEGKVYIECEESDYLHTFHCYNATTGERIWRYKSTTSYGLSNAWQSAVSEGRVYAPVGRDMICYGHNPQVHLESMQDTGASSNLGTTTFDDATYSLPGDISKTTESYQIQYNPASLSYLFDHWETTGELRVSNPYTNPTAVTISGDGTLRAVYKAHVHTITASAGNGGSISPSGSVLMNYGDDITFTVTPNSGYHIENVVVDTVSVGAVPSYSFTDVIDDHSITAYFSINQYTITASAGVGGSISPSGPVPVNYGQDKTFTITPNPGYYILKVEVDGANQGAISSYTFYYVTADHSISAFFGSDHDIAVIDVTPSKTNVGSGYTVQIDVTVENHGGFTESFNLTVYYGNSAITAAQWETFWSLGDVNRDGYINMTDGNLLSAAFYSRPGDPNWNPWADLNQDLLVDILDASTFGLHHGLEIWTYFISGGVIKTLPVINLAAGNTQTLTFTWGTSGISYDNYVIGSYAVPILGKEVDRVDNTFADGTIFVTIAGDLDGDRDVDGVDFGIFAPCYGSSIGQPTYNAVADFDGDGDVDGVDFGIFAPNYGKSW